MNIIADFIKKHSGRIEFIFKRIAIGLLLYSAFRFLTRKNLIYYDFVLDFIYSPITETFFLIAVFSAIILAIAKYIILKKPLF